MGAWLTPINMFLLHLRYYRAKFGPSIGQIIRACSCGDPPEIIDASLPAFQSHSSSLELTRIDRLIGYL